MSYRTAVSLSLLVSGLMNICYILNTYISYYDHRMLCGVGGVIEVQQNLTLLLPLNYAVVLIGVGGVASPYVKSLISRLSLDDLKRLFFYFASACCSISTENGKYCIRFYGRDLAMHKVLSDLAYLACGKRPRTVKMKKTYATRIYGKLTAEKALPLDSILNDTNIVKREFIRMIMSSDGWISLSFINNRIYPKLGLGSTLPSDKLRLYRYLLSDFDIKFSVHVDSRYRDRGFLVTSNFNALVKFKEIGGFVDGSCIKKGTFRGIEKNALLLSLIKLRGRSFNSKEEALNEVKWLSIDKDLREYLFRIMLG